MENFSLYVILAISITAVLALFATGMSLYLFLRDTGPPRPLAMKTVLAADKHNVTYGASSSDVYVGAQRIKNGTTVNGHLFATGTSFAVVDQMQNSKLFVVTRTGVKPISQPSQTPLHALHPIIQVNVINEETVRSSFNRYLPIINPGAYGLDILGTLSGVSNNILDKVGSLGLPEINAADFDKTVPELVQDSSFSELLLGTLQHFTSDTKFTLHDFIYITYRPRIFYKTTTSPTVTITFPVGVIFQSFYAWSVDGTDIMTITSIEGASKGDAYVLRALSKTTNLIEKNDVHYIVLSDGNTLLAEVLVGFDGSNITVDANGRPVATVTVTAPDPVKDIGPEASGFACFYCARMRSILVSGYPSI